MISPILFCRSNHSILGSVYSTSHRADADLSRVAIRSVNFFLDFFWLVVTADLKLLRNGICRSVIQAIETYVSICPSFDADTTNSFMPEFSGGVRLQHATPSPSQRY